MVKKNNKSKKSKKTKRIKLSKDPLTRSKQIQKNNDKSIMDKYIKYQERYKEEKDAKEYQAEKNLENIDLERLKIIKDLQKKQKDERIAKYGFGKNMINNDTMSLYFPSNQSNNRVVQELDTNDRIFKEKLARDTLKNNIVLNQAEQGIRNSARQLFGLNLEEAISNKGGAINNIKSNIKSGYKKPSEETNEDNAIRNLKNTELSKRKFQQKIENLQKENPDEINSAIQSMYDELPTSKLMMDNENDFKEYPVKPLPKPAIFNYYIEEGEIKKRKNPYLEMEFKKLKDIQDYRQNLDVQKYLLDKKENYVADDKISRKLLENKRRTDDFLFRQANKTDPLKYTLNEQIYKKANERTKLNDVLGYNEMLKGARIALNSTRTFSANQNSWYNSKILHPMITPEMSYTPTPMEIIMRSQYQAYNRSY